MSFLIYLVEEYHFIDVSKMLFAAILLTTVTTHLLSMYFISYFKSLNPNVIVDDIN